VKGTNRAGDEVRRMSSAVYPVIVALLLGIVALDVVAMRRLAHQRVWITGEGWNEYQRIAEVDPSRLNPTQRRLVQLGHQRLQAASVAQLDGLDSAMDELVRRYRRHLT
jgi:uncharacterized membrane protein YecN with MAPEG domain